MNNPYGDFITKRKADNFWAIARFLRVNRPIDGYYFEFGCFSAETFRMAFDSFSKLINIEKYVACDSFLGLPHIKPIDKLDVWYEGKLAMKKDEFLKVVTKHGVPRNKIEIVEGFYDKSLTPALQKKLSPTKAACIYIDCDLYYSTIPVLNFIKPFLQDGTVLVFDDWHCFKSHPDKGEQRAFNEFRRSNKKFKFVDFIFNGEQKSFICQL